MIETDGATLIEANSFVADVMAFKAMYVLCEASRGTLKATHVTCCLTLGKTPVWGVWSIRGKFLRYAGGRGQIEAMYPRLTWRRKSASFMLGKLSDATVAARRIELEERYGRRIPVEDNGEIRSTVRRQKVAA